jgi:hypothetical protein
MRSALLIAVTLAAIGCAARSRTPFGEPTQPVFLVLTVDSQPGYSVEFFSDRTVLFSSMSDRRWAKLSSTELAELSSLLQDCPMSSLLAAYETTKWPEIFVGHGAIRLRQGLGAWEVPSTLVGSLPQPVRAVLQFADSITGKHFGADFTTHQEVGIVNGRGDR